MVEAASGTSLEPGQPAENSDAAQLRNMIQDGDLRDSLAALSRRARRQSDLQATLTHIAGSRCERFRTLMVLA